MLELPQTQEKSFLNKTWSSVASNMSNIFSIKIRNAFSKQMENSIN